MNHPCTTWRERKNASIRPQGATHVWRTTLDWPSESVDVLAHVLSPQERERAASMRKRADRLRAIIGRSLLRLLLGGYLALPPEAVRLDTGPRGKPLLARTPASRRIDFNLSHSGNLVLIAIVENRAVGVDVEAVDATLQWQEIAAHYFSPTERAALASLPPRDRLDGFYACWTRKEAYVKARADGLSLPLDQFDVTVDPHRPAKLLDTRHSPGDHTRWTLADLNVGPGYKAALAVEGPLGSLDCWDWPAGRTSFMESEHP